MDILYNWKPQTSTSITPFDLVVSRPISPLLCEDLTPTRNSNPKTARLLWANRLEKQVNTTITALKQAQARHKAYYDRRVRPLMTQPTVNRLVFLRLEIVISAEQGLYKLSLVTDSIFKVLQVTDKTVFIPRQLKAEELTCDWVTLASSPDQA